ncbi:MAG: preprotein translocase subunit SecE [Candidatus Moranbacteria bacterium]|jgi:preprotein translocase subunit SecE|nr:preprotein translocase subunit SecE [Candidatus Moranbacteria bacterium]MDQ5961193.1 Protein translocase subunit SecE [Patescibacteria group bacterium]
MGAILSFLREAKAELIKVSWPDRKTVFQYTVIVIILSLIVAIFLGALDSLFSFLVKTYLLKS